MALISIPSSESPNQNPTAIPECPEYPSAQRATNKSTSTTSFGVEEIRRSKSQRESQNKPDEGDQQGTEFWPPVFGYRLKVTDTLIALFTGLLFFATIFLACIARGQTKDSRAVQRAHVFVLNPQSEIRVDSDNRIIGLRLWVTWKNSGTTPTLRMVAMTGATWTPEVDQFAFGNVAQNIEQPFVLGPGAEIRGGEIDISPQHTSAIFNQQGHQFLWGWARYRDIFPGSAEHVVEFCFKVTVEGQLGLPPFSGRVNFSLHGEHNRYYENR